MTKYSKEEIARDIALMQQNVNDGKQVEASQAVIDALLVEWERIKTNERK